MRGEKRTDNKPSALRFEKIKEIIHPQLVKILSAKTTGELVVEGHFPETGNYLIVANHVCIEDIPTLGQAIDKHFYLLVSDEDRYTIDGLGLELNGTQWVKRTDGLSRKKAYGNIVEILKRGKNFAMYPEATWNLSPNMPILPMNHGCIRMSLDANVPILPVVTFFTDKKRYTCIGEPYVPTEDLCASISELRDIMATMLYNQRIKYYEEQSKITSDVKRILIEGEPYYFESREHLKNDAMDKYVREKYNAYKRARKDMDGVRHFESQFIFTPKDDGNRFFQEFNSRIYTNSEGKTIIERISSENYGYEGPSFGEINPKESFGFGYNEHVLKMKMKTK